MISFKKNELKTSKSRLFIISSEQINIIAEAQVFSLILLSCYSFYIMPLWCEPTFSHTFNLHKKGSTILGGGNVKIYQVLFETFFLV